MGRKKVDIRPIPEGRKRQVTFMKRKSGLLKKAMELSILCQCDMAVVIFNHNGKLYDYGSSDIHKTIRRFRRGKNGGGDAPPSPPSTSSQSRAAYGAAAWSDDTSNNSGDSPENSSRSDEYSEDPESSDLDSSDPFDSMDDEEMGSVRGVPNLGDRMSHPGPRMGGPSPSPRRSASSMGPVQESVSKLGLRLSADSFPVSTLMAPARRGGGASASSAAMGSQMHGHGTSDGSSCQRYRFTEEEIFAKIRATQDTVIQ